MTRKEREAHTLAQMIAVYCRRHHSPGRSQLCPDCRAVLDYALERIDRCPQGEAKSSCRKCPIHCYRPAERARIREIMRYVGPRMLFIHPISALRHLLNEMR